MLTVPVFAAPAKVSLLDPVPRSIDTPVVSAAPRVMVSAPVPPVMVSVLETVACWCRWRRSACRCRRRDRSCRW